MNASSNARTYERRQDERRATRTGQSAADRLKKKRQAIQIKKRQLDLDDDAYRALLRRVAGVKSSTELTPADADAVLEALARLGAPRVGEWGFVFRMPIDRQAAYKKIYRCAQKIGKKQTPPVDAMSKAWVEGIARQSLGLNAGGTNVIRPLEMCSGPDLHLIVQILESWAKKIKA
jgi:hypothetical protein